MATLSNTLASALDAVKLPARIMAGLFLTSLCLLILRSAGYLDAAEYDGIVHGALVVILVASGFLFLTNLTALLIEEWKRYRRRQAAEQRKLDQEQKAAAALERHKEQIRTRLLALAEAEHAILAEQVRKGEQSFHGYCYAPYNVSLQGKEIIYSPAGQGNMYAWPYTITDIAWVELLAMKEAFLAKDEAMADANPERKKRRR